MESRQLLSAPATPVINSLSSSTMYRIDLTYTNTDGSRMIVEELGEGDGSYHKVMDLTGQVGTFSTWWTVLLPGGDYTYRLRADRDGLTAYAQAEVESASDFQPPGNLTQAAPVLTLVSGPGMQVDTPDGYRAALAGRWADRPLWAGGPTWGNMGPGQSPVPSYAADDSTYGCSGLPGWDYELRAYSDGLPPLDGNTSSWCDPVGYSIGGATGGSSGLTGGRSGDSAVGLAWNAPPPWIDSTTRLIGGSWNSSAEAKVVRGSTYTFSNLSPGRWYFKAYIDGQGLYSPVVVVDIIAAPTCFGAYLGSGRNQVRLIWDNPNPVDAGFRIDRRVAVTGTWATIASPGAGTETYDDTLPADYAGKTYEYRIVALGADGYVTPAATATGAGIALQSVTFANTQGVYRDTGSQSVYSGAQWFDANMNGVIDGESGVNTYSNGTFDGATEHRYPVSYPRSTNQQNTMLANTVALPYFGIVSGAWKLKGEASGYTFPAQTAVVANNVVTASFVSQEALPQAIRDTEVDITWKLSTDGGTSYMTVGESVTRVYVTGATNSGAFETVLDIGCGAADGVNMRDDYLASDQRTAVDHVWGKFSGLDVKRVDGTKMVYDPGQSGHTAVTPLSRQDGHGQCSAWADLLYQTLGAQGISTSKQWIRALPGSYKRFCVKDGSVQGGANLIRPNTEFGFHVLVRVTVYPDRLFDPSMGKYTDRGALPSVEEQWENDWVVDFQKLDNTWLGSNPADSQIDWTWGGY